MSLSQTKKGFIWNTLGSGMFAASTYLLLMLVSRSTDISTSGEFSIAFTVAQQLYIVSLFGANSYQMTDYKSRFRFRDYSVLKVLTSVFAMLCCVVTVIAMNFGSSKIILTLLLTMYMIVNSVAELYQSLFFKNDRLDLSGSSLFYRILISTVAFGVAVILTKNVVLSVSIMLAVCVVATYIFAVRPSPKFINDTDKSISKESIITLSKMCLPIFIGSFLMTWIISCPKYAIEFIYDDEVQGIFNMVFMPAQIINLVGSFVFKPYLSKISGFVESNDKIGLRNLLMKIIGAVFAITLITVVGMYLVGNQLLSILFSVDLSDYRLEIALVIIGGGFEAIVTFYYWMIIIMRRQKYIYFIYAFSAVFAVVISAVLIKRFEIMGGVISFILTMIFVLILSVISTLGKRRIGDNENDKNKETNG